MKSLDIKNYLWAKLVSPSERRFGNASLACATAVGLKVTPADLAFLHDMEQQ